MTSNILFQPLQLGALSLPNRIVMAPLTRCRAPGRVPNATMQTYYCQRATAGLIFTEATSVDPMGVGYPDTPGIWTEAQTAGWKSITRAVHAVGGLMVLQLWHVGRLSDPIYLNGEQPVAPSALAAPGHPSLLRPKKPFVVPRALGEAELPQVVAAYRLGAENAAAAGFDGVELHGANGYLLDQFLQDNVNLREDAYGGSLHNRTRLFLEVADAVVAVMGANRVGVHLAPRCDVQGMGDSNPEALFTHLAKELGQRGIAYLCARESLRSPRLGPTIKAAFGGPYIANEGFTPAQAAATIAAGEADAVAFGRAFIANPDLPYRLRHGLPLQEANAETFYSSGPQGYTDYAPTVGSAAAASAP